MIKKESPLEDSRRYEGVENLEVMKEAKNYNSFLRNLIYQFASDTTSVLDFGAGIGTFTDSLGIPKCRVTCIEPDTASKTHLANQGFAAHGDISRLASDQFTYAFSLNVLEHIEDDFNAVYELYRVLCPGGRILIFVPAFNLLYSAMDLNVGHFRRYNIKGMTHMMEAAGFVIEKSAYTDALGFLAALAYKVLSKKSDGILDRAAVRIYDRYLFPISRALSVPLAKTIGKNLYVVASKPIDTDKLRR